MPSPLDNIKKSLAEHKASQEFQDEILKYARALNEKELPIIFTIQDLSFKMGLPFHVMTDLLNDSQKHYKSFKIQKKTGGHRWITSPDEQLKRVQHWIYKNILKEIKNHDCSFGFVHERSIADNARKHVGQEVVMNIDLYRFFDSIEAKRVAGIFNQLGYHPNLSYSIAELLTTKMKSSYWRDVEDEKVFSNEYILAEPKVLPQGSPVSPRIANYVAHRLDVKMEALSKKLGVNYSRYADDITFSGDMRKLPSIKTLRKIISEEGFYLNEKKTKYLRRSQRQMVTGVVVNDRISVTRSIKDSIRTELYHCIKKGPENHLKWKMENKKEQIKSNYRDYLLGKVCFINAVEPQLGKKYLDMYNQIKWGL